MTGRDHIQKAMRNHSIVYFIILLMTAFGIFALPNMNKDEFPQFTIRQGVVAAIYPGATAQEVEEQVTIPLENYLNGFEFIDKHNTYSISEDGIVYVYVMLRNSVESSNEAWNKIRAGLDLFHKTNLPIGVLQTVLIDDFGNTSSMLLAIESDERSHRDLEQYAKQLCTQLRTIPEMGRIKILGTQRDEIAIHIDPDRLAAYGIDQKAIQMSLLLRGIRTIGGNNKLGYPIQVDIPYTSEEEIKQHIVWADPVTGANIRLQDIATIERQYQEPERFVTFYNGDPSQPIHPQRSCIIVNMEMVPGNNIVAFGEDVETILQEARSTFPPDIRFHRITDQPKVVNDSVLSFLKDIIISILVVIAVMLLLFQLRTALVASTGVPVCIAICIGLMYITGIELNTVTLAALIFVLGMIVDDSVIVIDGYSELLEKGHSRWYSAAISTKHLFVPMTLATCSISGMFFPMTKIIDGPLGDFIQLFPYAVLFALTASIFYAAWATPYMATRFIKRQTSAQLSRFEKAQNIFFSWLQQTYHRFLQVCFDKPWVTYTILISCMFIGLVLMSQRNLQLLPKAERECFAVEIHLEQNASIEQTAQLADSLARMLRVDPRITSITSFVGQASPRFHATYTPQMAKPNYAQFIVNTISTQATADILREYTPLYENYFSNAYVRFKQMDYQAATNPLEVRIQGEDWDQMGLIADSIKQFMAKQPELAWVHTNFDAFTAQTQIKLHETEAARLGITETMLSLYLQSITQGVGITDVWENDYKIPVVLYNKEVKNLHNKQLEDIMVPTAYPALWVPLRQVATIVPQWHHASIERRNSVRTITIGADIRGRTSQVDAERKIKKWIGQNIPSTPEGITISYGGLSAINKQIIPQILWSVVAALLVMFVLLLYHFGKVSLSLLALSSSMLCIFGAFVGLTIFQMDISITVVLGIVSLIGIIVRNAIIMYEYAEELRRNQHLSARDAAFKAGLRRMRPVFLTSATTALGVLPMILAQTSLWMPMGVVICFGTILTLPLTITILPVLYWKIYEKTKV